MQGLQQIIEFIATHPAPVKKSGETHYGVFPNEASVLRLVTALLSEISEQWETGKIYLNMNSQNLPQP